MLHPTLAAVAVTLLAAASASSHFGHQNQIFLRDTPDAFQTSPSVLPSPQITGLDGWASALAKAKAMVDQMTLDEKVSLTGNKNFPSGCSGTVVGIPRLGFPGLCLNDAGNGVRATDFVSGFVSGIGLGASWNKDLARQRGIALGGENRRKGVNVLLGPVVGPAWTVVKGGRNWEGASADPYLSGALAAETIIGVQNQSVMTSIKHFIGNEQETHRTLQGNVQAISSNIDDKTMHELYLWPFQDAVKAGTANVMCSYNRLNNTYACGNSKTLNGLLKNELGFQGFVVSDWNAQHALNDALSGLDMGMPNSEEFWGQNLVKAVHDGAIPESRVTDMATRIIASWYFVNQDHPDFPAPGVGMPENPTASHQIIDARDPKDAPVLLQGAIESHVLVKNEKKTLPLRSPHTVSVFGYSSRTAPKSSLEEDTVGSWRVGLAPVLGLDPGTTPIGSRGTLFGAGGSGAITPQTHVAPHDALVARAARDGFTLNLHDEDMDPNAASAAAAAAAGSDVCLVLGNAWSSEGSDRPQLEDEHTDQLIRTVADRCARTVVVLHNAGPRLVGGFVDHPNVTALVFAHLPGQQSGEALVALLWGDANPSGKLPYTVARTATDYGSLLDPVSDSGQSPQAYFNAGVDIDYKYFERARVEPRYEFGFGLSYTRFEYAQIAVPGQASAPPAEYPNGPMASGGPKDLWDVMATVTCRVSNTGPVAGAEAAQLYVRLPGHGEAKQLRGFAKPTLQAGEAKEVSFGLTRRDLSVWDTERQQWQLQRGTYEIYVGSSSRNLPLTTNLTI